MSQPERISMAHLTNYHILFWQDYYSRNIKLFKTTTTETGTRTEPLLLDLNPLNLDGNWELLYCDGIQAIGRYWVKGGH